MGTSSALSPLNRLPPSQDGRPDWHERGRRRDAEARLKRRGGFIK